MTQPTQSVTVRRTNYYNEFFASGTVAPVLYDNAYDGLSNVDVLDLAIAYDPFLPVTGYAWNGIQWILGGGAVEAPFAMPYTFDPAVQSGLPSYWTAPTWAVTGGVLVNTPTEGAELLTDGGLENWASATNLTSWTEALAGTSTVNQDGTNQRTGTYCARLDIDGSSNNAVIKQSKTGTVGQWLVIRSYMKCSAASKTANYYLYDEKPFNITYPITTDWALYPMTSRQATLPGGVWELSIYQGSAANASIYVDDVSVKQLTKTSLFATLDAGESDVTVKGAWSIALGTQAGVIMNLDDPANPQNFVLLLHNGSINSISLYKCVNGTFSDVLVGQLAPYVANANIELRKTAATTYQIWYNGAQVGADQTINNATINSNTIHGIFSTWGGNSLNRFFVGQ